MKTAWMEWMAAAPQLLLAAGLWSIGEGTRGPVSLTLGLWSLQQVLVGRGRD